MENNHKPTKSWEEWVRVLANSSNPRDKDLLVTKIRILLHSQREELCGRLEKMREECDSEEIRLLDDAIQAIKNND